MNSNLHTRMASFGRRAGGSELDEYANGQSSGQDHERDPETPASPAKSDRDFTDNPPEIQVCYRTHLVTAWDWLCIETVFCLH